MTYRDFRDIPIWQSSRDLVSSVYSMCEIKREIARDFGFRDQLQRAVLSVMNNIAEGFDSPSNKVFGRYLGYSIQSCSEVISMTYVLEDVFGIHQEAKQIREAAFSLKKQIKGFRKYLLNSESRFSH